MPPPPTDPFLLLGAWAGLIGGVAGVIAAVWTIVWAVAVRSRVRWSMHRVAFHSYSNVDGSTAMSSDLVKVVVRNVGSATANDVSLEVHYAKTSTRERSRMVFPESGRVQVLPGEELLALVQALPRDGELAHRPYGSGDDTVFDFAGIRLRVVWLSSVFPCYRLRWLEIDRRQVEVPLTGV